MTTKSVRSTSALLLIIFLFSSKNSISKTDLVPSIDPIPIVPERTEWRVPNPDEYFLIKLGRSLGFAGNHFIDLALSDACESVVLGTADDVSSYPYQDSTGQWQIATEFSVQILSYWKKPIQGPFGLWIHGGRLSVTDWTAPWPPACGRTDDISVYSNEVFLICIAAESGVGRSEFKAVGRLEGKVSLSPEMYVPRMDGGEHFPADIGDRVTDRVVAYTDELLIKLDSLFPNSVKE